MNQTKRNKKDTRPMIYGYIRTSTTQQLKDRQVQKLKKRCDKLYDENGVTGATIKRPKYERLVKRLKLDDTLIVTSLDRAFRSTMDALTQLDLMRARDIGFRSLDQNFDTTTPDGRLFYTLIAAMAEWERAIIRRRTKEGMVAARKRGSSIGRPKKLTSRQIDQIYRRLHQNPDLSNASLAREYGISPKTLRRTLNQHPEMKASAP